VAGWAVRCCCSSCDLRSVVRPCDPSFILSGPQQRSLGRLHGVRRGPHDVRHGGLDGAERQLDVRARHGVLPVRARHGGPRLERGDAVRRLPCWFLRGRGRGGLRRLPRRVRPRPNRSTRAHTKFSRTV
jgi:hypothetical protein